MNVIDEWIDSDGAKRDALKFKNGCYISGRRCGKTAFASSQIEQYLKDHPDAKIAILCHNGHSYYKELLNSVYGYRKSQHDDALDAVSEAIKEIGVKQREEMLEKSKLTNEEFKRMLNNSHYGICWPGEFWPSEIIDACERIDKYRKEEKQTMANQKQEHIFVIKNTCGDDYKIIIDKDFRRNDCPYRVSVLYLKNSGEKKFAASFEYRYWDHVETQLMYDLINNGFSIRKDYRDNVTYELKRAKDEFSGRSYMNFDSPYQGGYTTGYKNTSDKSKVKPFELMPKIEKVIFNPPATIVKWNDGTKTVVKCQDGDEFDWEKGLAMAYIKRVFNNERTYYGLFKKNEPENYTQETLMDRVNKLTKVIKDFGANASIDQNTIEEVKRYSNVPDTSSIDAEGPLMPL